MRLCLRPVRIDLPGPLPHTKGIDVSPDH
jgi:hypothetical protein